MATKYCDFTYLLLTFDIQNLTRNLFFLCACWPHFRGLINPNDENDSVYMVLGVVPQKADSRMKVGNLLLKGLWLAASGT